MDLVTDRMWHLGEQDYKISDGEVLWMLMHVLSKRK